MVVHRNARQSVVVQIVIEHYVLCGRGAGEGSEDANSGTCAGNLEAVAFDVIVSDGDPGYTKRDGCGRYHGGGWAMRGDGDSTVERIVVDRIAADEIVVIRAGFISDENPA